MLIENFLYGLGADAIFPHLDVICGCPRRERDIVDVDYEDITDQLQNHPKLIEQDNNPILIPDSYEQETD